MLAMKHPHFVPGLIAAICLAVPATGFSSALDRESHPAVAGDSHVVSKDKCGGWCYRGRHYGGHYWGPRVYVGGPFLWGPPFAFSFYSAPTPAYYDGPRAETYRGVPVDRPSDGKSAVEDNLAAEVQHALADRGFYHGPIDGEIGSGSRAAIRAYQQEHGLDVNGHIDNALLHSLRIE